LRHGISGNLELANIRRKLYSEVVGNYFEIISAKNSYKTAISVKRYTLIIFFLTLTNVVIMIAAYWDQFLDFLKKAF